MFVCVYTRAGSGSQSRQLNNVNFFQGAPGPSGLKGTSGEMGPAVGQLVVTATHSAPHSFV